MTYDFQNLSPYDFELLVRDLLQAELGIRLESFATGPDGGIDLRYARSPDRTLIVQCKHYARTGYDGLRSHLRARELPKIEALQPASYMLATSVPMTPARKAQLIEDLTPFIAGPDLIVGAEDLNNVLALHPEVEKHHFKLWLTSTTVLQTILNNDVYTRSTSLRESLEHRLRIYVQNKSFLEALDALREHHAVVIAGQPGIGKSMLAEMLMVAHIDQGYEPIVISGDIAEAERVYNSHAKQIFYYDDFLGQTGVAEKFSKNEDARLTDFMKQTQRSASKRLILTTREYILAQAAIAYEKFDRAIGTIDKVVINLGDYTRFDRAHILYNHLHFSALPPEAIESVLRDRKYRNIVAHNNYNPRLIETVSELASRDDITAEGLADYMLETFENPERLWAHAFEQQLSVEAQDVLLALLTLPPTVTAEALRDAADGVHQARGHGQLGVKEFRDALRTLDGTFVGTAMTRKGPVVFFRNPSVRDYLIGYLNAEPFEVGLLVRGARYFDQVALLWGYARSRVGSVDGNGAVEHRTRFPGIADALPGEAFAAAALATYESGPCGVDDFARVVGLHQMPETTNTSVERRLLLLVQMAASSAKNDFDTEIATKWAEVLDRWTNLTGSKDDALDLLQFIADDDALRALFEQFTNRLDDIRPWFRDDLFTADDYGALRKLTIIVPSALDQSAFEEARDEFAEWLDGEVYEILHQLDSANQIDAELARVRQVAEQFDVDIDEMGSMSLYEDRIRELDREPDDDDYDRMRDAALVDAPANEFAAIDSLFDSLRPE